MGTEFGEEFRVPVILEKRGSQRSLEIRPKDLPITLEYLSVAQNPAV